MHPEYDWKNIARLVLTSRTIDTIEETELYPAKKVLYQFSAKGHGLAQILLGSQLNHKHDAAGAYYRSRPLLLSLGLSVEDAFAGPLAKSGAYSDGRDIGVVCNLPNDNGCSVLPMSGDVGSQYTPVAGWAQAITYHRDTLGEKAYQGAIATVFGGEGSVATNGFWSALTMATTLKLPMFFYIEDNGYAISVPSDKQTPGGNIAANLASFANLRVDEGDGTSPEEAAAKLKESIDYVRSAQGPALLRLTVPRLTGHSGQDTQAYKSQEVLEQEKQEDPLPKLKEHLVPSVLSEDQWQNLAQEVETEVRNALEKALNREEPDPANIKKYVFFEEGEPQKMGGLLLSDSKPDEGSKEPSPEGQRINMLNAIRKTLQSELEQNKRVLAFGEDVGPKGGVHAATKGLQEEFGEDRVFDTSLSEEGIIGRAVGMAISGLMPVAEIQFRKYADPATEQLKNCGSMRWRTNNRFAAPIVVRLSGGFAKCGDPWHSSCGEVMWLHNIGWQVAFPSNAEDSVGLLRAAIRSNNPTIFFEHRHQLDSAWARRPYPGDDYVLDFGKANIVREGTELSIITWGAMVERVESAVQKCSESIEVIDLRTLSPWDKDTVEKSIEKTRKCLIVHEDTIVCGFGAEISATLSEESFMNLDAPIKRLASPQVRVPYNVDLMNAVVPSQEDILTAIKELIEF